MTVREIKAQLGIGLNTILELKATLEYQKACSCWVPHLLMDKHKRHALMHHHNCFNMVLKAKTCYSTTWLVMKAGFTISSQKWKNRVWNGITQYLQNEKGGKTVPWLAELWKLSFRMQRDAYLLTFYQKGKLSMNMTTFRCSKNCNVHFVKSVWWKRLASFNTTTHSFTMHMQHQG